MLISFYCRKILNKTNQRIFYHKFIMKKKRIVKIPREW